VATTEISAPPRREQTALLILGGAGVVVGLIILLAYLNRPPQMGTSEEAFNTVDALYTAVRSRDEKRLGECEQRLHGYRDAGKLPPAAAASLDAIIQRARSGGWEGAARQLYDFMYAQRREGPIEHGHHARKAKSAKGKKTSPGT
jgi:hypothetical protein